MYVQHGKIIYCSLNCCNSSCGKLIFVIYGQRQIRGLGVIRPCIGHITLSVRDP